MFLRSEYNYDTREASDDSALWCLDESRTQQSQTAESDINEIVRRFGLTGELPSVAVPPTYEDFSNVGDFFEAQELILRAQASFNGLSAEVRARFSNNPGEFVEFCEDPANLDEMRKLGLAVPQADPSPVPASPVG